MKSEDEKKLRQQFASTLKEDPLTAKARVPGLTDWQGTGNAAADRYNLDAAASTAASVDRAMYEQHNRRGIPYDAAQQLHRALNPQLYNSDGSRKPRS